MKVEGYVEVQSKDILVLIEQARTILDTRWERTRVERLSPYIGKSHGSWWNRKMISNLDEAEAYIRQDIWDYWPIIGWAKSRYMEVGEWFDNMEVVCQSSSSWLIQAGEYVNLLGWQKDNGEGL